MQVVKPQTQKETADTITLNKAFDKVLKPWMKDYGIARIFRGLTAFMNKHIDEIDLLTEKLILTKQLKIINKKLREL